MCIYVELMVTTENHWLKHVKEALEETKNMHWLYHSFIQRTGSYMFRHVGARMYNQCILLVSSNASDNARYEH
jgi:hypothetical protein